MPERSQQILDLQAHDLEIGRLTRRIEQIDAALADTIKERAADRAVRQAQSALLARQREQRDLEMELASVEARIKTHEAQLYSGRGSPRELEALRRDVEHDRQRQGQLEEQVLAAMEATEQAQAEVQRIKAAAERVLAELAAERAQLAAERQQLQAQRDRHAQQRAALAAALDPAALVLYERLRQRMPDGIAAAEVVQNRCEGCRTTLPSAEVQQARRGDTLHQCSVCGRILHVPHG
jgi:predicted  nucleic acid-binding Zn-ribbon protein